MNKKIFLGLVCVLVAIVGLSFTNQVLQAAGKGKNVAPATATTTKVVKFDKATAPPKNKPPTQTVRVMTSNLMINGNGRVQLSGIKVESKIGNQIIASGLINDKPVKFTIETDGKTITRQMGATSTLEAVTVDSSLSLTGTFQSFYPNLTLTATEIKVTGGQLKNLNQNKMLGGVNASSTKLKSGPSPSLMNRLLGMLPTKVIAKTKPVLNPASGRTAITPASPVVTSSEPVPVATSTLEQEPEVSTSTEPTVVVPEPIAEPPSAPEPTPDATPSSPTPPPLLDTIPNVF